MTNYQLDLVNLREQVLKDIKAYILRAPEKVITVTNKKNCNEALTTVDTLTVDPQGEVRINKGFGYLYPLARLCLFADMFNRMP